MIDKGLKSVVNRMCNMIENVGEVMELGEGMGDMARTELGMFMMYLSASDGEILKSEVADISDICGVELSSDNVASFIEDIRSGSSSEKYESEIPESLKLTVGVDNVLLEAGKVTRDELRSDLVIETYTVIGKALVQADDDVSEEERKDYQAYIDMLKKYQKENL